MGHPPIDFSICRGRCLGHPALSFILVLRLFRISWLAGNCSQAIDFRHFICIHLNRNGLGAISSVFWGPNCHTTHTNHSPNCHTLHTSMTDFCHTFHTNMASNQLPPWGLPGCQRAASGSADWARTEARDTNPSPRINVSRHEGDAKGRGSRWSVIAQGKSPTSANGGQIWATGYVGHQPSLQRLPWSTAQACLRSTRISPELRGSTALDFTVSEPWCRRKPPLKRPKPGRLNGAPSWRLLRQTEG
jgi:hypothetical protein